MHVETLSMTKVGAPGIRAWAIRVLILTVLTRGLIPVGFMPGALGLEVCPGGMDPAMARMVHAHHHQQGGAPTPSNDHGGDCVFALSAGGVAPACVPGSMAVAKAVAELLHLPASFVASVPTIVRAQSPRAPPTLS
jgi:hypothetical protein